MRFTKFLTHPMRGDKFTHARLCPRVSTVITFVMLLSVCCQADHRQDTAAVFMCARINGLIIFIKGPFNE